MNDLRSSSDSSSIFSRAIPSKKVMSKLAFCSDVSGTTLVLAISSKRRSQADSCNPSVVPEKNGIQEADPSGAKVGTIRIRLSIALNDAFSLFSKEDLPSRTSWARRTDVDQASTRTSEIASTVESQRRLTSRPNTAAVSSNSCNTCGSGTAAESGAQNFDSDVSDRPSSSKVALLGCFDPHLTFLKLGPGSGRSHSRSRELDANQ